jgi:hypothetical protein
MEVEEETYVTESGANIQPQSTTGLDYPSNQDMALQGAQTTQVGSRPRRHGLDTTATHGIISRLGDVDDDNMPGFGRASLINTTDQPSPPTIDWASLGQSEFDLLGTCVGTSRRQPATQLVINPDTLGRSEIAMPGDNAGLEVEDTATSVDVQGTWLQVSQQLAVIETEVPTRKSTGRRHRLHHVPSKSHQAKRAARRPGQP